MVDKNLPEEAYRNYRTVVGADTPLDAEPTPEQITVMYNKVITRGDAPYADFSVLTPFGRHMQKQLKAKGYFLQEDGSWKQGESRRDARAAQLPCVGRMLEDLQGYVAECHDMS